MLFIQYSTASIVNCFVSSVTCCARELTVEGLFSRDATGLNLSSFELIELLIFGLGPSPSLGPILIVELRALGVELRALTRAFAIIVLNDLNACFLGFLADFFTLLHI